MTFEDLESWQQARHLTRETYNLTRRDQIARDFGLCGQIQRAAVSTMSNIARPVE
jgi:four helix bundle protein